ncbi:hypothetical protein [Microbulbifer sp. TYP-18]|uniref:hypothetical protein n=1 Tax=Microbulbifer sp. TYP-18 TaxID=3230024 RepID=UPI0034C6D53C
MSKYVIGVLFSLLSSVGIANEDVGFGYIKGIKIGHGNGDAITVYLEDGYTRDERNCQGVVNFRAQDMSASRYNQITSVLLSANVANKKVRLHSHLQSGCNATFVAMQETYF